MSLGKASENLDTARRLWDEARTDMIKEIVKAHADGMPIAQIAKKAHISRQTVYSWLEEAGAI